MRSRGPVKFNVFEASNLSGEEVDFEQVFAAGSRCRLHSVMMQESNSVLAASNGVCSLQGTLVHFRNGALSDDILVTLVPSLINVPSGTTNTLAGSYTDRVSFHGGGILFDNGLSIDVDFSPGGLVDATDEARLIITVMYS